MTIISDADRQILFETTAIFEQTWAYLQAHGWPLPPLVMRVTHYQPDGPRLPTDQAVEIADDGALLFPPTDLGNGEPWWWYGAGHEAGHVLARVLAAKWNLGLELYRALYAAVGILVLFDPNGRGYGPKGAPAEMWADAFSTCARPPRTDDFNGAAIDKTVALAFFRAALDTAPAAPAPIAQPVTPPTTPVVPPSTPPIVVVPPAAATAWPYFSQWDPDHVGTGDCVPTSAKMLVDAYTGEVVPISEMRRAMDLSDDGIIDLGVDAGVSLQMAAAALTEYGVPATIAAASALSFDDLLANVASGRPSLTFVKYSAISNRQDQGFGALHAIVIAELAGDAVRVLDPDRWGDARADPVFYARAELEAGWIAGAPLGGGAVIPENAIEEVDMTPEQDKMLREIHDKLFALAGDGDQPGSILTWLRRHFFGQDPGKAPTLPNDLK